MSKRNVKVPKKYVNYSTRDAICAAAAEICGEKGVAFAKLREIARQVGIQPASIYSYFDGLDAILASVVEQGLKSHLNCYENFPEESAEQIIFDLCHVNVKFYARNKGITRLLLTDLATVDGNAAFNANEHLLRQLSSWEIGLIGRHFDISDLNRMQCNDLVMSRVGMTLTMISTRWLLKMETGEAELKEIAETVSKHVLGYLARVV